jgi:hypothetical protein
VVRRRGENRLPGFQPGSRNLLLELTRSLRTSTSRRTPRFGAGGYGEGRLAIRAARFVPEADFRRGAMVKNRRPRKFGNRENRGSFEGAIRIPLRSPLLLFNDLTFLDVPRKSQRQATVGPELSLGAQAIARLHQSDQQSGADEANGRNLPQ